MNTQDIQQIVRDLDQAKEAAQSFAEGSVGQFRQVQAAMSNLAQVTGSELGGIRTCWEEAGQEVGENAVPLLQEAVGALLGDLGKIGNLGDILPGGEKLSGVVNGLTTALGGLSGFLAENGDLIGKIGLSEEHTQKIAQVAATVLKVRSHLAEVGNAAGKAVEAVKGFKNMLGTTAEAVPQLKNVLGATGKTIQGIGAAGAVAFVGWEVGKLIGEVTGLNRKLVELAENRALKGQKSDRERFMDTWTETFGGLEKTNRNNQTAEEAWNAMQERDRQKAERKRQAAEKPQPEPVEPESAAPAVQKKTRTSRAKTKQVAEAEPAAAEEVAEARDEALQEQEEHGETVLEAREEFTLQAENTIAHEGKLLARAETTAAEQVRQARVKALQDQKNDHERRLAQIKQQGQQLAAAAKQASAKAEAARTPLLQTGSRKEQRKARKEAEEKARQKERAETRLDRQIAGARRREAELKRAGYTTKEARGQMTERGRELLKADDLRRQADRLHAAARRASARARKMERKTGTKGADTQDTGTQPNGTQGVGTQGAGTLSTGALPPAAHIPDSPPLAAPPAGGAEILGELQTQTHLLRRIAQSEGVQ